MDIKKLTTHIKETQTANQVKHSAQTRPADSTEKHNTTDKVSLESYKFKKDEILFAKIEYQKHVQSAFEKLKETKARLTEYEEARAVSAEKAAKTDMGKLLNDPAVWGKIARDILND